jgi:broad-specificity NMP kinase
MDRIFVVDNIEENELGSINVDDIDVHDNNVEVYILQKTNKNIYEEMMKISIKNNKQSNSSKKNLNKREIKLLRRDASWLDK